MTEKKHSIASQLNETSEIYLIGAKEGILLQKKVVGSCQKARSNESSEIHFTRINERSEIQFTQINERSEIQFTRINESNEIHASLKSPNP